MMNALAMLPVSTLCDVDKSLPVADPAIRPITGSARLCGPAYTAVATDEFLSTLWAINDAAPVTSWSCKRAAHVWQHSASCWRPKRTAADSAESSSTVTCATAAVYRRSCRCGLAARCLTSALR